MTTTLYGIKSCDTVRRARRWLEQHGIEYVYHDLREDGLDPGKLRQWATQLGWETLLNRRSTTWKQLPVSEREGLNEERALALLQAHPTLLKRPLVTTGGEHRVGFDAEGFARWFQRHTL